MNGHLTREGITADLEAMRDAGIGGVIIMREHADKDTFTSAPGILDRFHLISK